MTRQPGEGDYIKICKDDHQQEDFKIVHIEDNLGQRIYLKILP